MPNTSQHRGDVGRERLRFVRNQGSRHEETRASLRQVVSPRMMFVLAPSTHSSRFAGSYRSESLLLEPTVGS